jgi:hypothetical protein
LRIHVGEAAAEQTTDLDERHHLWVARDRRLRKVGQQAKDFVSAGEVPHRDLTGNPGMTENETLVKESRQGRVTAAKMADPNRGVDQDHADAALRRGVARKSGSDPANAASRRALSRSMSA